MDIRKQVLTNYGDWFTRFGDIWKTQLLQLGQRFVTEIELIRTPPVDATDVPIIFVKKNALLSILLFLKEEPGFCYDFLSDITATDEENEPRFEVVYNLFSTTKFNRIRIKTRVKDGEDVQSAVDIWPAANWAEREIFDMFGIKFLGHPDLRRILMDERFQGHPLRKDYPLRGYQIFTEPEPVNAELLDSGARK
ncbi:MAG: NADH-quinone oxidoreductase subunit C [Candidatus Poribacteria bacterium]